MLPEGPSNIASARLVATASNIDMQGAKNSPRRSRFAHSSPHSSWPVTPETYTVSALSNAKEKSWQGRKWCNRLDVGTWRGSLGADGSSLLNTRSASATRQQRRDTSSHLPIIGLRSALDTKKFSGVGNSKCKRPVHAIPGYMGPQRLGGQHNRPAIDGGGLDIRYPAVVPLKLLG